MAAMSLATDIGLGVPLESGLTICLLALRIGERMGLDDGALGRVYHLALLRHIGCTVRSEEMVGLMGDELVASPRLAPLDMANLREFLPVALAMPRRPG